MKEKELEWDCRKSETQLQQKTQKYADLDKNQKV